MGWKINQMDMKVTFLNGVFEDQIYIEKLEGFQTCDQETLVCRLRRSLYGPKQVPQVWYTKIDNCLSWLGFTKIEENENLYHIVVDGKLFILVLYVDDLIWRGDEQLIRSCK